MYLTSYLEAGLGEPVARQVADLLSDPNGAEVNPSAIRLARERLAGVNETLDQVFADFFEERRS